MLDLFKKNKRYIILFGISFYIVLLALGFYFYYKYKERFQAFNRLRTTHVDKIKSYIDSYDVLYSDKNTLQINSLEDFNKNVPLLGYKISDQWEHTENLYAILHDLCRIGGLRKMYVPPQLNHSSTDIQTNQLLAEKKLAEWLQVNPGEKMLELGCGCGAISESMSHNTNCFITGINLDEETLEKGRQHLKKQNNNYVTLEYADYNEPLKYADESFDGCYQIQSMTFSNNLSQLFKEIYRVLKPGKRLVIMDGVILDNFDKTNQNDMNNIIETQKVCAAGGFWHPKYWEKCGTDAGFEVVKSTCGDKYPHHYANELSVLIDIDNHYEKLENCMNVLVSCKLLPKHLSVLIRRLREGSASMIELCKQHKLTTNYFFIFEKPLS